jgi:hypothetical protein
MRTLRLALPCLALALACAPATAYAASSNDNRASASTLTSDSASPVDVTGNTLEASEPNTTSGGCAESFNHEVGATEWYRVTGTGGPLTITTDEPTNAPSPTSTAIDTVIFVYPHGSDGYVVCNDDISPTLPINRQSSVTFQSTVGQVYDVQVGQFKGGPSNPAGGLIVTTLRPTNDMRSFPAAIASGVPLSASNDYASVEDGELTSCMRSDGFTSPFSRTVWFSFTAPSAGTAVIRTNGGLDTVETVYQGTSTTPLACNDDLDAAHIGPSGLTLSVTPGEYLIQVGGFGPNRGSFTQTVDFTPNHDLDGDGSLGAAYGGPDCNDNDPAIHPGANDVGGDGVDQNCDGHDALAAPALSAVSLTHARFRVGPAPTARSARRRAAAPVGTTFRFTLSTDATLTIRIERSVAGRRAGGRCVAPTRRNARAKRCTRYVLAGTLRRSERAGADSVAFSGRIGRTPLAVGRYRATLTAKNAAGAGRSVAVAFAIVKR